MPFGAKPRCGKCKSNVTILWRKNKDGSVICNSCAVETVTCLSNAKSSSSRKSTRLKTPKQKVHQSQQQASTSASKGDSSGKKKNKQRASFKRSSTRLQNPICVPMTKSVVYYQGSYLRIGDVVSLVDFDGGVFYAQIRGFLEDQYFEKYGMLTWLIPTTSSPKEGFDLKTYLIGPEEDIPRKLQCMEFVCHSNLEYFMAQDTTYPIWPPEPTSAVVLTRSGPQTIPYTKPEQPLSSMKEQGVSSEF